MIVLGSASQCAALRVLVAYYDRRSIEPVSQSKFPGNLPVLVVLPATSGPGHTAHVVYAPDVPGFLKDHPEHSFLVPQGEEASLRKQLQEGQKASGARGEQMNPPFFFDFKVLKRESGRQELEVDGSDDDWRMKSWYVAKDKSYEPGKLQTFFGPGMGLLALPLSVAFNGAFWLTVGIGVWAVRKLRR